MSERVDRCDAIHAALRRLEQYPTLSPFCRLFYRLIYDSVRPPEAVGEKLRQAFHLFLRSECRRHQAVGRIVHRGKLDLLEVIRVGRSAQNVLVRLCRAVETMEPTTRAEATVRELLLAECNYHLGRTEQVVRALRRAIRLGCGHPLVHFALGYNVYCFALQRFTRAGKRKGEVVALDPPAFEHNCRDAIAAFRRGLGGEAFDAQIYWWIGLISEMLGEHHEARLAYRRAMEADPENFETRALEKLKALRPLALPGRSPRERARLSRLGPITEEEIREARRLLAGCHTFPPFFSA